MKKHAVESKRKPSAERKSFFEEINHNDDEILEKYHWWCSFLVKLQKITKVLKYFILQNIQIVKAFHWVKSVQIRSFFCSVFSLIRTEYGEIRSYSVRMRTRKNFVFRHFSRNVYCFSKYINSFHYFLNITKPLCNIYIYI